MAEVPSSMESIDNRFYRRGMIVAVLYAVVDILIIFFGGPFVFLRLIGVIAVYYAIRDMVVLREAGLEWGWTRYVVLVFVGIGGFLGYFYYAWRRTRHLQEASIDPEED